MMVQRLLGVVAAALCLGEVYGGQQMVGGHVGCQFSNSICSEDEECVYDGLFGNCQKIALPKDTHTYKLTSEQLQELEGILQLLIESGYTWRHKFTQCVLLSTLLTYRYHFQLDLKYCEPEGSKSFPYPTEEHQNVAQTGARLDRRGQSYSGYDDGRDWEKQDGYDDLERIPGDGDGSYNEETYQKRFNQGNGMEGEEDAVGGVDDFLNNLSSDELNDLKEFLVEEENADGTRREFSPIGRPVKKSSAMQTNVVVHFDPGESEDSDTEAENAANDNQQPEPALSNVGTAEQMMDDGNNRQGGQRPTALKEQPLEKAEYPGQFRTGLVQNSVPVVIPGAGSQMGLTTIYPSALAKDNTLVKLEPVEVPRMATGSRTRHYLITMYVLCGVVGVIIAAALAVYVMRRHAHFKDKIAKWAGGKGVDETTNEYQDLCRQHMQTKLTEKTEPVPKSSRVEMISAAEQPGRTTSTGSSTSSWTEEPVVSSMDISTGHIILSYMEDHLMNKDRLQKEWDSLCAYDAEPCSIVAAIEPTNMRKNRYTDILPYEHSRVKLNPTCNVSGSDYINACSITDHDPRNPAYIAAQGPLPHTVADFWQMVWEQGSVVIVNLTRLTENTISVCHRYWPEEGSDLYHIYEVHLVSEHAWCDDYVVRSFFLKNLQTNETRTITQFHFLTWPNLGIPSSTKTLLDFRRKVNKSYRGRSCPIVVHCSDGAGRTGTYCLIDMALNRLHKGAKEIDIAATLEHIRDQRVNMVRTKEQFEFALAAVAEEVQAIVHVPATQ